MLKRNLLGLSFFALLQAAPALAQDKPDPAAQAKPAVAQPTLNDARRTLDSCTTASGHTAHFAYRTPAEFRSALGYGDVESEQRFPHPHSPDYYGGEIYSPTNLQQTIK
jgi:hypothetical protein